MEIRGKQHVDDTSINYSNNVICIYIRINNIRFATNFSNRVANNILLIILSGIWEKRKRRDEKYNERTKYRSPRSMHRVSMQMRKVWNGKMVANSQLTLSLSLRGQALNCNYAES